MDNKIENKLKILETYDKLQADEARKIMKVSLTEPKIVKNEGPFFGWVECTLPVQEKDR